MQDDEVFGEYLGRGYILDLLTVPPLTVFDLASRPSQVLRLVNGQLAGPSVYLPLGQSQEGPLLLLLTGEAAREVELPIRY